MKLTYRSLTAVWLAVLCLNASLVSPVRAGVSGPPSSGGGGGGSITIPGSTGDWMINSGTGVLGALHPGNASVAPFVSSPSSTAFAAMLGDANGTAGGFVRGTGATLTNPIFVNPTLGTIASGNLAAGTNLPIDGGTTGTLPVNRGGLGRTTYTNGMLPIGNTTTGGLSFNRLTAGSNVVIDDTSTPGSIIISSSGGGGSTGALSAGSVGDFQVAAAGGTFAAIHPPNGNLASFIASPSSTTFAAALGDATGGGAFVRASSPVLVTPNLGTPSTANLQNATNISLTTGLASGTILPVANGGMGRGTYTAGLVPIGNGTGLSFNRLAAGANVTIDDTTTPGAITISAVGGSGGGGVGTSTSGQLLWNNAGATDGLTPAAGLAIDSTGKKLLLTSLVNDQSGAVGGNYTMTAADAAQTVLVGSGGVITIPAATSPGFGAGWSPCVLSVGTGNATLSAAPSVFVGAGGATSLTLRKTDTVCPTSTGSSYATSYFFSGLGFTTGAIMLGTGNTAPLHELASRGTTTTVLHGNATGDPSFAAVALGSDVSGTLPVANGGLGRTSYTNGMLPIGNTTTGGLSFNRLTAGANVTIDDTTTPGAITISATGGGGGTGCNVAGTAGQLVVADGLGGCLVRTTVDNNTRLTLDHELALSASEFLTQNVSVDNFAIGAGILMTNVACGSNNITISGLAGGVAGAIRGIRNNCTTGVITLADGTLNTNSTAANRFDMQGNVSLSPKAVRYFRYEGGTVNRWQPLGPILYDTGAAGVYTCLNGTIAADGRLTAAANGNCGVTKSYLTASWKAGVDPAAVPIATPASAMTLTAARVRIESAIGAAGTVTVYRATPSQSCGGTGSTAVFTAAVNANTAGPTVITPTLAITAINLNDTFCFVTTGTGWAAGGSVAGVTLEYTSP